MAEKKCVACGEELLEQPNGLTVCSHCEMPHNCHPAQVKACARFFKWNGANAKPK